MAHSIKLIFIFSVTMCLVSACSSRHVRRADTGYVVSIYQDIYTFPFNRLFVYDAMHTRREYAEGRYYFASKNTIILSAMFDPNNISYTLHHNSDNINHINVGSRDSSIVRCISIAMCRVVIYPNRNIYPPVQHDSLSTELFDVAGDETIVTRIAYTDWYRISIQDTVDVIRKIRTREFE